MIQSAWFGSHCEALDLHGQTGFGPFGLSAHLGTLADHLTATTIINSLVMTCNAMGKWDIDAIKRRHGDAKMWCSDKCEGLLRSFNQIYQFPAFQVLKPDWFLIRFSLALRRHCLSCDEGWELTTRGLYCLALLVFARLRDPQCWANYHKT